MIRETLEPPKAPDAGKISLSSIDVPLEFTWSILRLATSGPVEDGVRFTQFQVPSSHANLRSGITNVGGVIAFCCQTLSQMLDDRRLGFLWLIKTVPVTPG
jgi:hypothetical protein